MAEEERPALEVKRLVKTFGGKENPVTVLDGVDLTLARGDFVAVMGPAVPARAPVASDRRPADL
jgi:predicted ABC-type transport system involved in lysophospholipase L1 biosynthesis ATPase subunit